MKRTISLIVAVLAIIIPLLACGSTATGNTGTAITTTPSTTGTTPTAPAKTFKVGDLVQIGQWTVKVNSATTSTGDSFSTPKSGNIYVVVNVTVTNKSSSTQNISSALNFKLADESGQAYNESITTFTKAAPDGSVAAGAPLTGEMAYEVPSADHTLSFVFTPDITSTDAVTITLTI